MFFILILLIPMSFTLSFAQITVTGKVTSAETGEPIEEASVKIKGQLEGTLTDSTGAYMIEAPSPETVLEYSAEGKKSEQIEVGTQEKIDVELEPRSEEPEQGQEMGQEMDQITIEGTVICAETEEPLEGVSVAVQDELEQAVTDSEGDYEIEVQSEESVLEFQIFGRERKEVVVDDQKTINVELEPENLDSH